MHRSQRLLGILTALLGVLLISLLMLGEPAPAHSQGPTPAFQAIASITSNAGSANVRSGPSLDDAVIANLPNDTQVYILDLNPTDDWYRVRLPDGQEGWIFGQLLRILPTPTPEPATATPTVTPTQTPIPATPTPTATVQAKNPQSYLARAEIFIQQRTFDAALADLEAALQFDPNLDAAHLDRALVRIWQDDELTALDDLQNVADSARFRALLSLFYARQGFSDMALAQAAMALDMDSADGLAHYSQGEALASQQDYRGAAEAYARAAELEPLQAEFHLAHGVALANAGQAGAARAALERGAELAPANALTHVRVGNALIDMNAPDAAIPYFNRALTVDPQNAAAYRGRGDAQRALGQHAYALEDYETARDLAPDDPLPVLSLGRLYMDFSFEAGKLRDRYTAAVGYLDEAIRLDPQLGIAYYWRGSAREGLGDYAESQDDYFQAAQLAPEAVLPFFDAIFTEDNSNDDALFYRALAYSNLGRYEESIADWTELIRRYPDDFAAYTNRGVAYARQEDHERAIADYDRAIELGGEDSAIPWNNRGGEYHEIGRDQEALSDLDRAISMNPNYAVAYLNRSYVHSGLGDTAAAFDDLAQAIALDPSMANAYYQRALLYAGQAQHQTAVEDYDEAIALDPENADYYYDRAQSLHALSDDASACADLRTGDALGGGTARQPADWESTCGG